jgi:uncharacterized protein
MSELLAKVKNDIKDAMRAKETLKRDTLRMLTASVKQREVDERITLDDEAIHSLIQKLVKQRDESITQFKEAGRDELVEKESAEQEVLKAYLPKQLDDAELEAKIREVVASVGATSPKDMGKVMGASKEAIGSSADGRRISEAVKTVLKSL